MKTTIVNINNSEYDIFIGRPSIWGNPFKIGKDGTRKEVIQKYKEYVLKNELLIKELPKLQGKRLGCFCKPKSCHGDILVELLNKNKFTKLIKNS